MPWTPGTVLQSVALFVVSAVFEIGGGWFVWKAVREQKPHYFAAIGCVLLVAYGFAPTLQPAAAAGEGDFGRLDAAYGGVFIAASFLWGRVVDNMKLTLGDAIGSTLCLVGVLIILAWPRGGSDHCSRNANSTNINGIATTTIDGHNCSGDGV